MQAAIYMRLVPGLWSGAARAASASQQPPDDARTAPWKAGSVGLQWRDSVKIPEQTREARNGDLALELAHQPWPQQKASGPRF